MVKITVCLLVVLSFGFSTCEDTTPSGLNKISTTATPMTEVPTTIPQVTVPGINNKTTTAPPVPAPTTTSPPVPTTRAPPAPAGKPQTGEWNVTDGGVVCVMFKAAVQFFVPYELYNGSMSNQTVNMPVGNETDAYGVCGNSSQDINIHWGATSLGSAANLLTLTFEMNKTSQTYYLQSITVLLELHNNSFPGHKYNTTTLKSDTHKAFEIGVDKSYACAEGNSFQLNVQELKNITNETGVITMTNLQLQAFHIGNETNYGSVINCASGDSSDIVPIAVGCALVALVVIVLIAYLIGRRRSRARGYQSV